MNNKIDYRKQGKKNRASGRAFELKVRKDMESKQWIIAKWSNNVEFAERIGGVDSMKDSDEYPRMKMLSGKLIPCKPKYNPFTKGMMMISGGFPDFVAFKLVEATYKDNVIIPSTLCEMPSGKLDTTSTYVLIGVEVKSNGTLSKEEKEKCRWLLDNNIFSKILIARKGEKRGEIIYKEFEQS